MTCRMKNMGGEGPSETDVAPLVVRKGFRPEGVSLLMGFTGIGVFLLIAAILERTAGSGIGWSGVLIALGFSFLGFAAYCAWGARDREAVAVIDGDGITFPRIVDPVLRRWRWAEIDRIYAEDVDARGYRVRVVLCFIPVSGPRTRALLAGVPEPTRWQRRWERGVVPTVVPIDPLTVPAPRHVKRYIHSVAPELGLELIPPRHRPKGYPWRDIGGAGSA